MRTSKYVAWRKSTHSDGTGNCVEVAKALGLVAIRDSTQGDDHGVVLEFSHAAWREFLTSAKGGKTGA
jgi:Domain of unknown function (DUF397)